jgi:hypothetical protein
MTQSDALLFGFIGLMVLNNALMRLPALLTRSWLFWPSQLLNVGAAVYLMAIGIPDFEGKIEVMNWVLGLLFLWHVIQNNRRFVEARRAEQARQHTDDDNKRAAIQDALGRNEREG